MHTTIAGRRNFVKKTRTQVQVLRGAAPACVDDFCVVSLARCWVEYGDGGTTLWIGVGVGRVVHHRDGEGDDIVGIAALDAAGSQPEAGAVEGDVAHVAESGAANEKWEEEGEAESCAADKEKYEEDGKRMHRFGIGKGLKVSLFESESF